MKCPKCSRTVYSVCSNPECHCRKRIPEGETPLIYRMRLPLGLIVSEKIGDFFWKLFIKIGIRPETRILELEKCPYCGFTETYDFWEDLSYQDYYGNETALEHDKYFLGVPYPDMIDESEDK